MTGNEMLSVWQSNQLRVPADVLLIALLVALVALAVFAGRRSRDELPRPSVLSGAPRPKRIRAGMTTETWSTTTSSPPTNTPFAHTMDCKTPDATPEWIDRGGNTYERICTCNKEVRYPPMWRRPDILSPAVMQHEARCEIADKPELLKHAVTIKKEATYDFATCGVCSRNWYAFDRPPE